jgi:hypothetical protein
LFIGVHTTLRHYSFVPDYRPNEKAVSLRAADHAKDRLPVFRDSREMAAIMHLYLKRRVTVVERHADIQAERHVFVSRDARSGGNVEGAYYLTVEDSHDIGLVPEGNNQ